MGLLELGWINRNIGLHVPYGLSNVFGKPCSGSVLVSRHISVQVHISEILFSYHLTCKFCRNPTLAKCGGEAQHLEKLGIWSPPGLPNVQSSTAKGKTPRIGVFLVSLERS